jgi:hypothetical protein
MKAEQTGRRSCNEAHPEHDTHHPEGHERPQTDWYERGCCRGCRYEHTKVWGWRDLAEEPKPTLNLAIAETFTASDGNTSLRFRTPTIEEAEAELAKFRPQPDWADLREAARKAGWTVRTEPVGLRPVETKIWAHYPPGDRFPDASRGWARVAYGRNGACRISVELHAPGRDPRSRVDLVDPTPAKVLAAARLLGLGGSE